MCDSDWPAGPLDSRQFVNCVHRTFKFDAPPGRPLLIDETMAEAAYCLQIPQLIMNIFMDDEKKLMNCMTYSLGELASQWQRPQMRVLESHLRLVNVLTESLNELYQYQLTERKCFRPSIAKKDIHLQFVPINLHLQRCQVSTDLPDADEQPELCRPLEIYTVGAFSAHNLGFDGGGMKAVEEVRTPTNNNSDISQQSPGRVWRAMRDYFRVSSLTAKIEQRCKQFSSLIERRDSIGENNLSDQSVIVQNERNINRIVNEMDLLAKQLVSILNPNEVEQSLLSLDSLRTENDLDNKNGRAFNNKLYERSLSDNGNGSNFERVQQQPQEVKRHHSLTYDEQFEPEPVDLLHLNIRASLISISSKMNSTRTATSADFEPSKRKLLLAIYALQRVASLAYAIEAVKLERDQLEQFYSMRLRRAMIFSQALTTLVIGVCGESSSNGSFLRNVQETGTIVAYFEGLLSCYGDELEMLQDMAFSIEELSQCVTFELNSTDNSVQSDLPPPRLEGNGYAMRVTVPVAASLDFPAHSSVVCSVLDLLFNIGINEQATLAETFGQVRTQEEINKKSFLKLENYLANQAIDESDLLDELDALKSELYSNRAKNTRILQIMESISRRLSFIRYTSCKSAKDRTAMATTLEEARLAFKLNHNLNEIQNHQLFQKVIDTLRSEGTRRENTRKNVGQAKYAFNSLQLMTLPKLYRPPSGTYGNSVQS